jgi:hypothetical protein
MARSLDSVLASLKNEVKDSVSSYFSPVRAVVKDVAEAVHGGSAPSTPSSGQKPGSAKPKE